MAKSSSLLAIDVGNTQITIGLFDGPVLKQTWRLQTNRRATADELGVALRNLLITPHGTRFPVTDVMVASVVPPLDGNLKEACLRYLSIRPLFLESSLSLGIRVRTKNPIEVGADRLANAVAVHAVLRQAAIVVDFGTATTFDCIDKNGDYLGGVISPGLAMAHDVLVERTAKLPKVPFEIPSKAMGQTTKESLQSGLFWGYIGLVEGVIARLSREMKCKPAIILTGGLSPVIGPHLKGKKMILPDLTLQGLRLIWERNR